MKMDGTFPTPSIGKSNSIVQYNPVFVSKKHGTICMCRCNSFHCIGEKKPYTNIVCACAHRNGRKRKYTNLIHF